MAYTYFHVHVDDAGESIQSIRLFDRKKFSTTSSIEVRQWTITNDIQSTSVLSRLGTSKLYSRSNRMDYIPTLISFRIFINGSNEIGNESLNADRLNVLIIDTYVLAITWRIQKDFEDSSSQALDVFRVSIDWTRCLYVLWTVYLIDLVIPWRTFRFVDAHSTYH